MQGVGFLTHAFIVFCYLIEDILKNKHNKVTSRCLFKKKNEITM